MSVPVLINAGGGTARGMGDACRATVERAFAAAGLAVEVQMVDGNRIAETAALLADRELVVVGGGDGTLGSAAGELAKGGAALGILPLGTRNHLAKDLDIPADIEAAAQVIAKRHVRRIDLARVNGRGFVNNASIGVYPELVEERDRRAAPKWLATLPATAAVVARLRHHRLRLAIGGRTRRIETPLLFIGNNRYALDAGSLGQRAALDDGVFSIFAVAPGNRRQLIGMALRTLVGRANPDDFAAIGEADAVTVDGHARRIAVALDGEVVELSAPLRFTLETGGLAVVAPLEGADAIA